jgi:hypothetical protein
MKVKIKRNAFLAFYTVLFLAFLAGCASKPIVDQYRMLNSAADMRLMILESAGRYYKAEVFGIETKDKILEIDVLIQETGKTATLKLKEVDRLNTLRELDPGSVPADQYLAAQQAYEAAKAKFQAQWARLNQIIAPYLMKWLEEAAKEGGN